MIDLRNIKLTVPVKIGISALMLTAGVVGFSRLVMMSYSLEYLHLDFSVFLTLFLLAYANFAGAAFIWILDENGKLK